MPPLPLTGPTITLLLSAALWAAAGSLAVAQFDIQVIITLILILTPFVALNLHIGPSATQTSIPIINFITLILTDEPFIQVLSIVLIITGLIFSFRPLSSPASPPPAASRHHFTTRRPSRSTQTGPASSAMTKPVPRSHNDTGPSHLTDVIPWTRSAAHCPEPAERHTPSCDAAPDASSSGSSGEH